jgi:hypothetical protein
VILYRTHAWLLGWTRGVRPRWLHINVGCGDLGAPFDERWL